MIKTKSRSLRYSLTPEQTLSLKKLRHEEERKKNHLWQLRKAAASFETERGEKQREHIVASLLAATQYLDLMLPRHEDPKTLRPLSFLTQLLIDLSRGNTHLALKALPLNHRPPCPIPILKFKAECLIFLALLKQQKLPKVQARHLVVDKFAAAAKVLEQDLSVKRLCSWERELRRSRTAPDGAALGLFQVYDIMFLHLIK